VLYVVAHSSYNARVSSDDVAAKTRSRRDLLSAMLGMNVETKLVGC